MIAVSSYGVAGGSESADLLKTFRAEYPSAALALEEAYEPVRIAGQVTRSDGRGKFLYKAHFEILRDGELVRSNVEVVESGKPDLPVGTVSSVGGNRAKHFEVQKMPGDKDYMLASFGPKKELEPLVHAGCFPLFAPFGFSFDVAPAREYLLSSNELRLVSAQRVQRDDGELIEVVAEKTNPDGEVVQDRFYFVPDSWALAAWDVHFTRKSRPVDSWHGRVVYSAVDNPPRIKSVENWHEASKAGVKKGRFFYEVEEIEFGDIPAEQFTLASLGIEEPAPLSSGTDRFWLLIFNAVVVLILGILVFLRLQKRKTVA